MPTDLARKLHEAGQRYVVFDISIASSVVDLHDGNLVISDWPTHDAAQAAEIERLRGELERLQKAGEAIVPYLKFTIGPESPGHHPTMPSAVWQFCSVIEDQRHG